MVLKLYLISSSPPVRSVLITASALGLHLNIVELDLVRRNEHLKPEFVKLNPQHTVPTLEDNGKIIWDSHAINVYLVTKYGKDKSLYPDDPLQRAIVDQRLHFDSGVLFPSFSGAFRPLLRHNAKSIKPEAIETILESYSFLEKFLEDHKWVAGDNMTLADLQIVGTVSSLDLLAPIDATKFPKITSWYKRMKTLPFYQVNIKGLHDLRDLYAKLKS